MEYDIIIVGAGPAGMAAGIAAKKIGLNYLILEKGSLVNSIFHFPKNMVFFTTPELLEIGGLPFTSPYEKPTRAEALRYYRKVADAFALRINFNEEVTDVAGFDEAGTPAPAFRVNSRRGDGFGRTLFARTVILATGYYDHPNLLAIPGEDLAHVSHYYTEPHEHYRKRVVVVGGNNSAAETALDLYRSGAKVALVHRRDRMGDSVKYWVRPDIENRIKEGVIPAVFDSRVVEIQPQTVVVETDGVRRVIPADAVFLMTGYHPDVDFLRRAGVFVQDETCVPQFDPATFETNIPGLYLAGAVVSGRETNRVFIENGRFHGETVIRHITTRLAAGRNGTSDR